MAKLIAVCRDEEFPFERRQIPLMIEETLTMVMEIPETVISTECVVEGDVKQFIERYDLLTFEELNCALMVPQKELFALLSLSVPCVGCRRSVERLYNQLLDSRQPALEPLIIKTSRVLTLSDSFLFDPRLIYALFYIHGSHLNDMVDTIPKSRRNRRCILHSLETHKTRSLGWMDVWDLLSQECRDEVVLIDSDALSETLENYLRKHRFCSECKSKVLKAYNILTGDIEGDAEKGYCATLYDGLKSCPKERHIHVLCDTDFIAHLIDRAEPELTGGRRERHARTIEIAQEEVLTCLGIHLWERLHRLWQKLRAEEQTWQMLFYLGVEALRKSFEMAVEEKQGISRLEQVVEEISEAERAKELKKEHKRLKKKKRKENKCKFANEATKEKLTNGHDETDNGKENECKNVQEGEVCKSAEDSTSCREEKPPCNPIETNGNVHEDSNGSCDPGGSSVESSPKEVSSCQKNQCSEKNSQKDSAEIEACHCGDEAKAKMHKKNGYINPPLEEKPRIQCKKQKGPHQLNGYINPPGCRSCGQPLSPRDKFDRGRPDRGRDVPDSSEICAKCASMTSEGGNRRNRKKYSRPKELHENLNPRPKNDVKNPKRHQIRQETATKGDDDDAELKLLKSMGWHRLDDEFSEDPGLSSFSDEAFISEQEIKEFQAKKKDLQNEREQLREKLRQQFQMMCIHHSTSHCFCNKRVNGIKVTK